MVRVEGWVVFLFCFFVCLAPTQIHGKFFVNQSLYLKICVCNVFAHSTSLSTPKVVANQLLINYLTEEAAVGTAVRPNMTIFNILQ